MRVKLTEKSLNRLIRESIDEFGMDPRDEWDESEENSASFTVNIYNWIYGILAEYGDEDKFQEVKSFLEENDIDEEIQLEVSTSRDIEGSERNEDGGADFDYGESSHNFQFEPNVMEIIDEFDDSEIADKIKMSLKQDTEDAIEEADDNADEVEDKLMQTLNSYKKPQETMQMNESQLRKYIYKQVLREMKLY